MNTQENNKMIAEFMQLPKVPCNIGTEDGHFTEGYKHPKIDVPIIPSGMQYKYSWDWLMPVIQKCLIGEAEHSEDVSNLAIKNIYEGICNQDISLAYESVVEFINKYNKNK